MFIRFSQVLALATMSLAAVSMIACSGGGGNSDSGKAAPPAPNPNQNPNPGQNQATGTTSLTKNFWCSTIPDDQGGSHQLRLELYDSGKLGLSMFALSNAGRGALEKHIDGSYAISGANINMTLNNQPETHVVRLDPQSPTGAPQLHIDSAVFDPCN